MHFISSVLGEMEKEGFKFFFPGTPSEWDENYLNSVMAHGLSLKMLRAQQRWDAEKSHNKTPPPPPLAPVDFQKEMDKRRVFHQSVSKSKANGN